MSLIEVKNISFGYSHGTPFEITALDNVSFTVEKGELVCVIGHTGSGKSTLMQMLNALLKPEKGEVLLNGANINSDKKTVRETRFKVGLCFQYPEYQLFEETCAKDIAFGPKNMGLPENEIKNRVLEAAGLAGLKKELLDSSPFELSGGQKRRCAIAGVMSMRPEVLILDEPTAGLDPQGRDSLLDMITAYREKTGAAVIVVTHSMDIAAKIADRIIVLCKGQKVMDGTPEEIFSRGNELKSIGLDLPAAARIIRALRENGIDVPDDVFTVNKAADVLFSLLKREGAV